MIRAFVIAIAIASCKLQLQLVPMPTLVGYIFVKKRGISETRFGQKNHDFPHQCTINFP
jgi:hypothetical protein